MSSLRFALIGPGRVGTALAYLLCMQGFTLTTVIGRSMSSLDRAQTYLKVRSELGVPEFTTDLHALPNNLDFILLGVRDDQIADMVTALWSQNLLHTGQVLIHLSGAQPSDVGQHSTMTGIKRLAMHPLQAVAAVDSGITLLSQSVWSMEGDIEALQLGERLLTALQVRWLRISKEQKSLYHASACVVSNYLVTLTQIALEMLMKVGFPPELAQEALLPLIMGTVNNLQKKKPEDALTGPIARGDVSTVEKHLNTIVHSNPEWLLPYAALGKATLCFAPIADKSSLELLFDREIKKTQKINPEEEEK